MPRTLTQILKEADANKSDYQKLISLAVELKESAYYMTTVEYNFGEEHISNYLFEIEKRHERFNYYEI